jgi:hypothetical protein
LLEEQVLLKHTESNLLSLVLTAVPHFLEGLTTDSNEVSLYAAHDRPDLRETTGAIVQPVKSEDVASLADLLDLHRGRVLGIVLSQHNLTVS